MDGVIGMFEGIGKNFSIWRHPFYKFKSHKQRTLQICQFHTTHIMNVLIVVA